MKKMQLIVAGVLVTLTGMAQSPVHLNFRAEKVDEKTYAIHITANIDAGWHIYSLTQPKQAISQPTKISFNKSPLFQFTGEPVERGRKEKYEDKISNIIEFQYGGTVEFVQTLTKSNSAKTTVNGNITYQACTDEKCQHPQTVPFSIAIE